MKVNWREIVPPEYHSEVEGDPGLQEILVESFAAFQSATSGLTAAELQEWWDAMYVEASERRLARKGDQIFLEDRPPQK